MDTRGLLSDLRAGRVPASDDLRAFALGLGTGEVSDAQAGAFAMGVCLGALGQEGRVALTLAMRDSGDCLSWDLNGPVLDKHSTGGLGDCTSLIIAPALVACGAYVPMISGRGLGHTGGTLDKLEAIPDLRTDLSEARLRRQVAEVGCAIVGATGRIAPADKRLYAVRDVTSTVDSLDLITASILSKKLAAGLGALVLDVKWGTGAFMTSPEAARDLAQSLVSTANAAGCPTTALISDMNQPLASAMGNALEIAEAMAVLTGAARGPLFDLSCALGAEVLVSGGLAQTVAQGITQMQTVITSGAAAEVFERMIAAQGGPRRFASEWAALLPEATVIQEVYTPEAGVVTAMDGKALGAAVVALGGGRLVETDQVDPSVGISDMVRLGQRLDRGAPIARIHARTEAEADRAAQVVLAAVQIGEAVDAAPLVVERITA
ncbi:thymidine phosphorylase [Donghicola sp. XS_ASV15]|uniref:thymidine phosphorylase n=1 Tax=Donghicola sp. XS_ASV15 TaxID=3241295 RepID=UPI0035116799